MMFEVIVKVWHYRPRRCSMSTYYMGDRGFLPEKDVLLARDQGFVRIMEDQPNV